MRSNHPRRLAKHHGTKQFLVGEYKPLQDVVVRFKTTTKAKNIMNMSLCFLNRMSLPPSRIESQRSCVQGHHSTRCTSSEKR